MLAVKARREALATVKQRIGSYDVAKLRELASFYREKVDAGDPYSQQAGEALKLVERTLSEREATKQPDRDQKDVTGA